MEVNLRREVKRGEIWMVNIPELKDEDKVKRSLQKGMRPFMPTSNEVNNVKSNVVNGIIFTKQQGKASLPTHVEIEKEIGLKYDSVALCEQIISLDVRFDFLFKICDCPENKILEIEKALKIQQQLLPPFDEKYVENKVTYINVAEDKYRIYKDDFFLLSMRNAIQELINYCGQYLIDYRQYLKRDNLSLAV